MEESEVTAKADNKKKKSGEGKNKAGGKSDINPLLPLTKEGALTWKWKGVHMILPSRFQSVLMSKFGWPCEVARR
jgi:hypothetical protein